MKNTNKNCLISFKVNCRFIWKGKAYKIGLKWWGLICRYDSIGRGENEWAKLKEVPLSKYPIKQHIWMCLNSRHHQQQAKRLPFTAQNKNHNKKWSWRAREGELIVENGSFEATISLTCDNTGGLENILLLWECSLMSIASQSKRDWQSSGSASLSPCDKPQEGHILLIDQYSNTYLRNRTRDLRKKPEVIWWMCTADSAKWKQMVSCFHIVEIGKKTKQPPAAIARRPYLEKQVQLEPPKKWLYFNSLSFPKTCQSSASTNLESRAQYRNHHFLNLPSLWWWL